MNVKRKGIPKQVNCCPTTVQGKKHQAAAAVVFLYMRMR